MLLQRAPGDSPEATAAAEQAASAEAAANADGSNAAAYGKSRGGSAVLSIDKPLIAQMTVASAAVLPQVKKISVQVAQEILHIQVMI